MAMTPDALTNTRPSSVLLPLPFDSTGFSTQKSPLDLVRALAMLFADPDTGT
jgi:hypothetical protein